MRTKQWTIWGVADDVKHITRGIRFLSTPRHGGFVLSKGMNERIKPEWRNENRYYEEDCEWSKVVLSFPQYFSKDELEQAQKTFDIWCKP